MAPPTKTEWRRRAKTARAALTIDHQAHVDSLELFLGSLSVAPRTVLTYQPMHHEVDLAGLVARCPDVSFAVTRTPDAGFDLTLHPIEAPAERHRYGFEQPIAGSLVVPDDAIDAVLVPGLAFDRLGNRLGHGAGYYDRLLARLRPSIPLVGITGGYVVAELPTTGNDVTMTHLCGPFGVLPVPLDDPIG